MTSTYVYHPINAFHLLKRFSDWMPQLQTYVQHAFSIEYDTSSMEDEMYHAASGLTDIYEFHNLTLHDFANGHIISRDTIHKANSKIDIEDLKIIANQAYENGYLAGYVDWLKYIHEKMIENNMPLKIIKQYWYNSHLLSRGFLK